MIFRILFFTFFIIFGIGLYLADKYKIIDLGKWDKISSIIMGGLALLSLVVPLDEIFLSFKGCAITADRIVVAKDIIEPNHTMTVTVDANNPNNHPLIYSWQAIYGSMNPGPRTPSVQSTYTAPADFVEDTISVDITALGCETVRLSKEVRVVKSSVSASHAVEPTLPIATPNLLPTLTPSSIVLPTSVSSSSILYESFEDGKDNWSIETPVVCLNLWQDFITEGLNSAVVCVQPGSGWMKHDVNADWSVYEGLSVNVANKDGAANLEMSLILATGTSVNEHESPKVNIPIQQHNSEPFLAVFSFEGWALQLNDVKYYKFIFHNGDDGEIGVVLDNIRLLSDN